MATGTEKTFTVGEFVEYIKDTKIEGAKAWIDGYINGYPKATWDNFLTQGINFKCANILIDGIVRYCHMTLERSQKFITAREAFRKEFWEKAQEYGAARVPDNS